MSEEEQASKEPETEYGISGAKGILPALKGMVSFFTIIRLPVDMKEFDAMERNFWLAPVIGALVGAVAFITCLILGLLNFGTLAQGVFALAAAYLFSKFLHFDGLTDFGDGMICSSGDREKHVRALKDTLVGAGGVGVAVITVLITVVLYSMAGSHVIVWSHDYEHSVSVAFVAFACEILVKNAQVSAAAFGEPGNGMASRQVGCTTVNSMLKSTALTCLMIAVLALAYRYVDGCGAGGYSFEAYVYLLVPVAAVIASIVVGWWMARTANRNFGFVNGDILGATNEISRAVILLVICVILGAL